MKKLLLIFSFMIVHIYAASISPNSCGSINDDELNLNIDITDGVFELDSLQINWTGNPNRLDDLEIEIEDCEQEDDRYYPNELLNFNNCTISGNNIEVQLEFDELRRRNQFSKDQEIIFTFKAQNGSTNSVTISRDNNGNSHCSVVDSGSGSDTVVVNSLPFCDTFEPGLEIEDGDTVSKEYDFSALGTSQNIDTSFTFTAFNGWEDGNVWFSDSFIVDANNDEVYNQTHVDGQYTQELLLQSDGAGTLELDFTVEANANEKANLDEICFSPSCDATYNGILTPLEFEGRNFTIDSTLAQTEFTHVNFETPFSTVPALFILPTNHGGNPANVRVKNVTKSGFDVAMAEPLPEDGGHMAMDVAYFAVNEGVHKIGNSFVEVGKVDTNKVKDIGHGDGESYGWEDINTTVNFCDPIAVANIMTIENEDYVVYEPSDPFLVPAIDINGSIQLALDKSEGSTQTVTENETIAYMIADANIQDSFYDSNGNFVSFETIKAEKSIDGWDNGYDEIEFINDYSDEPLLTASKISNYDPEPAWLRFDEHNTNENKISLTLDESRHDNERGHVKEDVAVFAFSSEFYVREGVCSYVRAYYNTTDDGYYYVTEGIAGRYGLQPFEIYCSNMATSEPKAHLPTVINNPDIAANNSNFRFTQNNDDRYYNSNSNKEYFHRIPVDDFFYAKDEFLNDGFSNINLIGTPFKVDFSNTALTGCAAASDTDDLRIGHHSQAVKVDPKVDYDNKCEATQIQFSQISDYYAKDAYIQNNYKFCSEVAKYEYEQTQVVPNDGYYLLKRNNGSGRLVVAYCDMSPPVSDQVWTLFLTLDGFTTDQKQDVVDNRNDTCSQIGMDFFVPNSQTTFNAIRDYLYQDNITLWEDYSGTVREYFNDYEISGWATDGQNSSLKPYPVPDGSMWPYGPMGIYKASDGANGSDKKMAKSKIFLTQEEKDAGFGSLDETGWVSILPEIDSSYEDQWWVADIAAGYDTNLNRINAPIEPNGDYDANNWLGWFADDNGNIVHYNDQNGDNRYRYSNYMCMGSNFYQTVEFENDSFIDAYDVGKNGLDNKTIDTKIVAASFDIKLSLYNDESKTDFADSEGEAKVRIVEASEASECPDATTSYTPWQTLDLATDDIATFTVNEAVQDARVQIEYDTNTTCSTDNFAIRPQQFAVNSTGGGFYAGESFDLNLQALDANAQPASGYNETVGVSFAIDANVTDANCSDGNFTIINTNFSFSDGEATAVVNVDEVGEFDFAVYEKIGSEFANVDATDTDESERIITEDNTTLVVDPYKLQVANTFFTVSNNNDWLYMSNAFDNNVTVGATVEALNESGNPTVNFSSECVAQDVDLHFDYTYDEYDNDVSDIDINATSLQGDLDNNVFTLNDIDRNITARKDMFVSGEANVSYGFKIDKKITPQSPVSVKLNTVGAQGGIAYTEDNDSLTANNEAVFYYAKTRPVDLTTSKSTDTTEVYIDVYDSSGSLAMTQQSLNWYRFVEDNSTTVINTDHSMHSVTASNTDGVTKLLIDNSTTEVQQDIIHLDIAEYLWYSSGGHPYNFTDGQCSTNPCLMYQYSGSGQASGVRSGDVNSSQIDPGSIDTKRPKGVKIFR